MPVATASRVKAPAPVKGVFRPGDGPAPREADLDDVSSTAEPASREYEVPDYRAVRNGDGEATGRESGSAAGENGSGAGEDGRPAAWDATPPRLHRVGEASDAQINAQLDRHLVRWLAEHDKTVGDAIELPADLHDSLPPT